jgi:hypothetical protein
MSAKFPPWVYVGDPPRRISVTRAPLPGGAAQEDMLPTAHDTYTPVLVLVGSLAYEKAATRTDAASCDGDLVDLLRVSFTPQRSRVWTHPRGDIDGPFD